MELKFKFEYPHFLRNVDRPAPVGFVKLTKTQALRFLISRNVLIAAERDGQVSITFDTPNFRDLPLYIASYVKRSG